MHCGGVWGAEGEQHIRIVFNREVGRRKGGFKSESRPEGGKTRYVAERTIATEKTVHVRQCDINLRGASRRFGGKGKGKHGEICGGCQRQGQLISLGRGWGRKRNELEEASVR